MGKLDSGSFGGKPRGKVGELIVAKYDEDRYVVRRRPVRKAKRTAGEAASQSRFALAVAYARRVLANPAQRAAYAAAARNKGKRACDLATADFLRLPEIRRVSATDYTGRVGGIVEIEATDDFEVQSVSVRITDLRGTIIESGAAALDGSSELWRYSTTVEVREPQTVVIQITATDHAGHAATAQIDHALVGLV